MSGAAQHLRPSLSYQGLTSQAQAQALLPSSKEAEDEPSTAASRADSPSAQLTRRTKKPAGMGQRW